MPHSARRLVWTPVLGFFQSRRRLNPQVRELRGGADWCSGYLGRRNSSAPKTREACMGGRGGGGGGGVPMCGGGDVEKGSAHRGWIEGRGSILVSCRSHENNARFVSIGYSLGKGGGG